MGYIVIDVKKCQGCLTCMLACSLAHHGEENLSSSQIQIIQSSFGSYPEDISVDPVQICDLCAETPFWERNGEGPERLACVSLCPVGAIRFFEGEPETHQDIADEINFRGEGWKRLGYPID